jgi:hypothetical protein
MRILKRMNLLKILKIPHKRMFPLTILKHLPQQEGGDVPHEMIHISNPLGAEAHLHDLAAEGVSVRDLAPVLIYLAPALKIPLNQIHLCS